MKLTFKEIEKITVGAVKMSEEADGIHFYKCTDKQVKAWGALHKDLGTRSLATTGVRLDFHTDSKSLSFTAPSGDKFELYIDGLFRKRFIMSESGHTVCAEINDVFGKPMDMARVTLYFPAHSAGVLSALELDDGAKVIPHTFDTKMLFIGDSITQGWDAGYDSLSYAQRTSRFFNAESVIHGVGGGYFHDTIFDSIDFKPEYIVIAFGTNDFGHYPTTDEMRYHARAFFDSIKKEYGDAKNVFVLSPIWRADFLTKNPKMGSFDQCRSVVITEAESHGFTHIDGATLVPPDPFFFADERLHPDALGFGIYAENLIKQMMKHM